MRTERIQEPLSLLAERMLVVMADMADGRTDRPLHIDDVQRRCNALGIKQMTDEQFEVYRQSVIERLKVIRKGQS